MLNAVSVLAAVFLSCASYNVACYGRIEPGHRGLIFISRGVISNPNVEIIDDYMDRGRIFVSNDDYDMAIEVFTAAIKLDPYYAAAYHNRDWAYSRKWDYTQAIKLDPDDALVYNNRGNAYRNKGFYGHAITDYNEAINLDPDYALAYNNRGNAYYANDDYDRARADFEKVLQLDPGNANALEKLARLDDAEILKKLIGK